MKSPISSLGRLATDRTAVALPEFGLVLIPLLLMLMGSMDYGYQAYVRSVALGGVETLTRAISIQGTDAPTAETALRAQIHRVAPRATITIVRGSVKQFGDLDNLEPLTQDLNNNGVLDGPVDTDGDGVPDKSDCWRDIDNNGARNVVTVGADGIGGADDIVRYNVTVTYNRLLPIWRFLADTGTATVVASTLVRRQPYEAQVAATIRCAT